MTTYRFLLPVFLLALAGGSSLADTSASTDYSIRASTVDGGGVSATSTDYSTAAYVHYIDTPMTPQRGRVMKRFPQL